MSETHSIGIADLKVISHPDKVRTTLGSCIGVALYDRVCKKGGMAHVMLPSSQGCHGDKGKFADTAVDWLVNEVLAAGCDPKRLSAKIAGGASMFGPTADNGLGERNAVAVKERLRKHNVRLVAEHIGGQKGRRMMLSPNTGEVQVQIIGEEPCLI